MSTSRRVRRGMEEDEGEEEVEKGGKVAKGERIGVEVGDAI